MILGKNLRSKRNEPLHSDLNLLSLSPINHQYYNIYKIVDLLNRDSNARGRNSVTDAHTGKGREEQVRQEGEGACGCREATLTRGVLQLPAGGSGSQ